MKKTTNLQINNNINVSNKLLTSRAGANPEHPGQGGRGEVEPGAGVRDVHSPRPHVPRVRAAGKELVRLRQAAARQQVQLQADQAHHSAGFVCFY